VDSEYDVTTLDLNIDQILNDLNLNATEQSSENIKYTSNLNSYWQMYTWLLQAIIDCFQHINNPLSEPLWRIKSGYNKLLASYNVKIKEIDSINEKAVR